MRKSLFLLSSVFLIAFILYSSGCGGKSQAQIVTTTAITTQPVQTTMAITTTAKSAAFSVTDLTIYPGIVEAGAEEFNIYVTVANTGGIQGAYEVVIYVEGIGELTESVTIDAGDSKVVRFTLLSPASFGEYDIMVNGLSASLVAT